jgi:hypothetical protein
MITQLNEFYGNQYEQILKAVPTFMSAVCRNIYSNTTEYE